MAIALTTSSALSKPTPLHFSSGFYLRPADKSLCPATLSMNPRRARNSSLSRSLCLVQARHSESDSWSSGAFVGGFILGGLVVGTLGCVFAPQISRRLSGDERKELMKKLPKFIYDEEKALEKQRKKLAEKIKQLNTAIDDFSTQMKQGDRPEEAGVHQ
ncbi:unnamed protein product [Cuscuta campestris]|uniref:Uncharacterized protein n=1 Tax=Cuscuta campestris TaxID=132261 RepID=A0A484KAW1_9ASTE|nr:unnamed protein product [Cuscuta campestris]